MLLFLQLFGEIWTLKWPPQSAGQCCQASPQCKPRAGGPSPHRSAGSCRTSTGRCGPVGSRGRSQSQSEDFLKNGWQVWSTSEKGWGPMKFLEQGSVLAPSVAFQWNPQFLFASVPTQFNMLSLFGLRVFRHIRSWVWKRCCWVFLIKLVKKCFLNQAGQKMLCFSLFFIQPYPAVEISIRIHHRKNIPGVRAYYSFAMIVLHLFW